MTRSTRGGVRAVLARWRGRDIELKTPGEIDAMRVAGALVARALAAVTAAARPGVSTGELDVLAEQVIRDGGGVPSFLGYHGYPASICASVNEQIVHGIPAAAQVLADGDLLSVDCGAIVEGWHGDAAVTVAVGTGAPGRPRAVGGVPGRPWTPGSRRSGPVPGSATSRTPCRPRAEAAGGATASRTGSSRSTAGTASARRCTWTRSCPTTARPGRARGWSSGMALAVEPMLTAGDPETRELDDGWTVVTADGSRAAHWEHTVAVTDDGPRILTLPA